MIWPNTKLVRGRVQTFKFPLLAITILMYYSTLKAAVGRNSRVERRHPEVWVHIGIMKVSFPIEDTIINGNT
jgi:hypothetical protein